MSDPEIMKYLRNIVNKLGFLMRRLNELEKTVMALGHATGTAFQQTKFCINELAANQTEVQEELADAVGNVRESTWCDPCVRTQIDPCVRSLTV